MQSLFVPAPLAGFFCSEFSHIPDDSVEVCLSGSILFPEGSDTIVTVLAALEGSCIQVSLCSGKTEILRSKIFLDPVRELSFYNLRRSFERIMFIIDDNLRVPFRRPVVIVGGELSQVGFADPAVDPLVEVEQFRSVAVNDLTGAYQPVLKIFL